MISGTRRPPERGGLIRRFITGFRFSGQDQYIEGLFVGVA
jgi:hypothetical protein